MSANVIVLKIAKPLSPANFLFSFCRDLEKQGDWNQ
jgi:hypothetical protein